MARKVNKTGRDEWQHYTKIERRLISCAAWRALSTSAQALYLVIRFEWKGPESNNNGRIRLSVRQAATKVGISEGTAQRAFHDLQAKGFLFITEMGALGCSGNAKAPTFELTEIPLPQSGNHFGRRLFDSWRKGHDYPVQKHHANNPKGRNGNRIPSPNMGRSHPHNGDVLDFSVTKIGMA